MSAKTLLGANDHRLTNDPLDAVEYLRAFLPRTSSVAHIALDQIAARLRDPEGERLYTRAEVNELVQSATINALTQGDAE